MIRASVGNVEAALKAPFRSLMAKSQCHEGARPVNVPKTESPANPHKMSFFLPILSDNLPITGESSADARVKAEMNIPTDATEAPNEVMYMGK